jgi:hypothetical protein
MHEEASGERTMLFALLTVGLLVGVVAVMGARLFDAVQAPAFVAIAVPTLAFGVFLRTHAHTWGREGKYLDLWSIPHFLVGVLLWLVGLDLVWVTVLAVTWEIIEATSRVHEYPTNRVMDVVLAVAGWTVAAWVSSGAPA